MQRRNAKPRISAAAATPIAITAVRSNGAAGALGCAATGLASITATGGAEAGMDDTEAPEANSVPFATNATLSGAAFDGAAAGFAAGAAAAGAGFPMPCSCNSISTRFFNASNCCRLKGRACGALASGAEAALGVAWAALSGASKAADSTALDPPGGTVWIAPLQECALDVSLELPPLACGAAPCCVAGIAAATHSWASIAEVVSAAVVADIPAVTADETPTR
ncbi:MAG: hypothetical protein V3Q69_10440 [Burkholderia sp.]